MNFYSLTVPSQQKHATPTGVLSIKAITLHGRCTSYVLFPGIQPKCHITAFISRHSRVDLMYSSLSSLLKSHKIKALAVFL